MTRLWFDTVPVWISASTCRHVSSVSEAARMLVEEWPDEFQASDKHTEAKKACLAALKGKGDIRAAREAFVEAAREAGLLEE
jgi:hypothetical protein